MPSPQAAVALATPFESLPAELIDGILESVSQAEVVSLWKSSKILSQRLDRTLFGTPRAVNQSMRWACQEGDSRLIRAAVLHGANRSTVHYHHPGSGQPDGREPVRLTVDQNDPEPFQVSTLALTARHNHLTAFTTLLKLGASLETVSGSQLRDLAKTILKAKSQIFLEKLLDAGVGSPLMKNASYGVNLVQMIQCGISLQLAESMINNGADPNLVIRGDPKQLASPLSTAIDMGLIEIVDILIKKGADIHGVVKVTGLSKSGGCFTYTRPDHLPIFAAATRMGRFGATDMMDLCLRHGANINYLAPALFNNDNAHFTITPIVGYLEAIKKWPVETGLPPKNGIDYFLKNGADIQLSEVQELEKWDWMPPCRYNDRVLRVSTVQVLLNKCNLSKLHVSQFYDTIIYLVQNEGGIRESAKLFYEFSEDSKVTSYPMARDDVNHPDQVPQWWDIVHMIIDKLQGDDARDMRWLVDTKVYYTVKSLIASGVTNQPARDEVLSNVVVAMAESPEYYGTFNRIILDRIQAAGADINGPVGEKGWTVLHRVCEMLNKWYAVRRDGDDESSYYRQRKSKVTLDKVKEVCLSLVDKGANPDISVEGKTAIDLLINGADAIEGEMRTYIYELRKVMQDGYQHYLENGSTPSILVYRADIRSYPLCSERNPGDSGWRYQRHLFATSRTWLR